MKLGEYVKLYREEIGMSQRDFAKLCNLSNAYISQLETGKNPKTGEPIEPSIKTYKAIAVATGVTIDKLFEALGPDAPVMIDNPIKMDFVDLRRSYHPYILDSIRTRMEQEKTLTPKEDAKMSLLWRRASLKAKRAAIAVLELAEGEEKK